MTLFNIQNQIAVKVLTILTILMMVASLVPSSVFAQAEGDAPIAPAAEQPIVVPADNDSNEENKDKKDKEKDPKPSDSPSDPLPLPEEGELQSARSINIPDFKTWICHANESNENANNPFNYIGVNPVPLLGHITQHDDDIIPSSILYAGKNLTNVYPEFGGATGQEILDNECKIPYEENDDLIKITQSTLTGPTGSGWYFESAAPFVAPFVFTTTAAKIGSGSLFAGPVGAVAQNKFIGLYQNVTPVKNIKSIAYDFQIASNTVADENEFYINIYANFASSSPFKFFDCRYDVSPSTGSLTNFTTITFTPSDTGKLAREAVVGTCPATLAGMEALSPGSVVRAIALNVGDTGTQDAGVSGYFDKVVIKTQDDTNYLKNTTTFDFEPVPKKAEVTVVATKIICTDESQLPNWGAGGADISPTTAADWVATHNSCSFAANWQFQYADQNGTDTAGDFVGEAAGYTTFTNPTNVNGVTTQSIPLGKGVTELHLREVLKDGYIPFSKSSSTVSAEFYCSNDVLNYDNWDFIRNPESSATYHCVAWNVKKPQETVKVHIYKYLVNGTTSAQVPNDSTAPSFPMISSWDAANLGGPGSGSYVLGNNEGGTVLEYAADTSSMSVPADYTTSEVTGGDSVVLPADAMCAPGKYRLVGYKQGDSVGAAESATLTTTAPVYTDITTDKYIIVVNEKCSDTKPVCEIGQNLMQNGSFENTPTVTDNGGQWQIFAGGIMNWLATLSSGLEVWNTFNGTGNDVASDGVQNVELDGDDKTNIAQDVTTIPGATYELKFDYSARAATALADSKMDAMINGVSALSVNTDGSAATGNVWEPKTTTFVAVGTSTKISFEDQGTANAGGGFGPLLDNVALCLVKEPEPLPTCTLTIKSDVNDYVVEKNAVAQTLSTINGAWVPTLGTSTAAWIWGDNPVVNATVAETQTFKKGFNWTGGAVTSATLKLSSDNTHKVTLGAFGVTDTGEFNYGPADISTYNVATGITAGANTLEIAVGNIPVAGSTAADNPAGLMYELTITGTGKSCGTIIPEVPKTTGTVTMCKVDEERKPLSGWTMTLLKKTPVDSVIVSAGNAAGVNTTALLAAGKSYVAVAQGTWNNKRTPLNIVDAEYSTEDNWVSQMDGFGSDAKILELLINGKDDPNSNWGTYNGAHTYAQMFTQTATGTAKFNVYDTFYGDNIGNLTVTVFEGFAGITDKNGCVTFTNVPFETYDADEVLKAGWEQVSGADDMSVTYNNPNPTVTIMNEMEDDDDNNETYILDGYKYECVEDGMYYCDEDGLAGWTIKATNGSTTLSTTTNANGYYSFEVEEGNWTVSEVMQPDWEQVDINAYGGEVVDETCAFEVEDDSIWEQAVKLVKKSKYNDYQCNFGNYYDEDGDYTPQTYTVTGYKWNDVDGDGVKDEDEVKLPNWIIKATQGSTTVSTTTDSNGNYALILPFNEGQWVVSETVQSGWTQTGLYSNGSKVILNGQVSSNCSFYLGSISQSATCYFGNKQNTVITEEPETPNNRGGNGGSGTRVTNRATPQGLVLGAATGTPACGIYLNDYMRMGNAASTTQVTKLQVFLNAVGITAPLTGIFDTATDAAVRAFQMQYKPEVLTPWYVAKLVPHENSTGWVYQLTRWKINNIVCPGSESYPVLN